MTHDPLCHAGDCQRCHGNFAYCINHICDCNLIARVRADERERAAERVAALPVAPPGMPDVSAGIAWNDALFAAVAAARGGDA